MKPVILDTDIGDDVDDALALGMILGLREFDLRGVVTVHAEVDIRARIAAKMLETGGRTDVPVAVGIGQPFNREPRLGWAQSQGQCLNGDERFDNCIAEPGVEFTRRFIEESDGPVTLLAIGPLTNVARLLLDHPEVKTRLDEIVIMGGLFGRPQAEYNILMDPEAAQAVFHAGVPMRIIPFDITEHCLMEADLMQRLADEERPLPRLVWELIGYWQKQDGRSVPVLHDPLAVGCLVAPELYTFERRDIEVVLEKGERYGVTRSTPRAGSPLQVCTAVDFPAFQELFRSALLAENVVKGGEIAADLA